MIRRTLKIAEKGPTRGAICVIVTIRAVSDESCDSDPNPRFENKCKIEDSDSDSDSVKFKKLIRIRIRIRYF